MKREEFEGLIKRLENFAQTKPGQYTARVALLAALGYAYLLGVLLLLLSATVALVWMVIAFPNAATIKICIIGGVVTVGLSSVILRA
ncbi:MAG TPA: Zn-dependent protease, partial [Clostridia bacterium]|nr:Zn-dependent protease [Clostridia bacterium]